MYTTRNGEGSPSLSERYFRAKSLTNCDVHPAESLFKHIPEPVKMLWKTKMLHTKQKQVILPLLKGE